MEEILACCVCLSVPPPPWFACENGHSICEKCIGHLTHRRCPICRFDFARNGCDRQRMAEMIVQHLLPDFACLCANQGCEQRVPLSMAAAHNSTCTYRMVRCPLEHRYDGCAPTCTGRCTVDSIIDHIREYAPQTRDPTSIIEGSQLTLTFTQNHSVHDSKCYFLLNAGIGIRQEFLKFPGGYFVLASFCSLSDQPREITASIRVAGGMKEVSGSGEAPSYLPIGDDFILLAPFADDKWISDSVEVSITVALVARKRPNDDDNKESPRPKRTKEAPKK